MNTRMRSAVELLLSYPDTLVAEMLGVRLSTLRQWMKSSSFSLELRQREREQRASLMRISRQAAINAAALLCRISSEPAKQDTKVLLEVLKAAGAFDTELVDPAQALSEIINSVLSEED